MKYEINFVGLYNQLPNLFLDAEGYEIEEGWIHFYIHEGTYFIPSITGSVEFPKRKVFLSFNKDQIVSIRKEENELKNS